MKKYTYLFYDIMKYPIPFDKEFFAYGEVVKTLDTPSDVSFSWAKSSDTIDEAVALIQKLSWLWKSLPFVEAIYVSNTMSFNAMQSSSDIDLFVVTSPKRLWLARSILFVLLFCMRLLKTRRKRAGSFDLDFFVSTEQLNLYSIKNKPYDPYLIYRLAHLVPIYQRREIWHIDIYEENFWLRDYLPSFPMEHVISLWIEICRWSSRFKKWCERILWWICGDMIESIIKKMTLPVLLARKKHGSKDAQNYIIADDMIKLCDDKRKKFAMKRKIAKKWQDN